MRTGLIAAGVAVVLCAAAVAGPAGSTLRCGAAEARWTRDLAISAKPRLDCASLGKLVDAFALLDQRDLPNAQARSGPAAKANRYSDAARVLLTPLRAGDSAAHPTCRALLDAVATTSDSVVALHGVELVTLIDNTAGVCTKGLRPALGDNPDAKGLLEQAADLCAGRKEPHCGELLRQAK